MVLPTHTSLEIQTPLLQIGPEGVQHMFQRLCDMSRRGAIQEGGFRLESISLDVLGIDNCWGPDRDAQLEMMSRQSNLCESLFLTVRASTR